MPTRKTIRGWGTRRSSHPRRVRRRLRARRGALLIATSPRTRRAAHLLVLRRRWPASPNSCARRSTRSSMSARRLTLLLPLRRRDQGWRPALRFLQSRSSNVAHRARPDLIFRRPPSRPARPVTPSDYAGWSASSAPPSARGERDEAALIRLCLAPRSRPPRTARAPRVIDDVHLPPRLTPRRPRRELARWPRSRHSLRLAGLVAALVRDALARRHTAPPIRPRSPRTPERR